jgi:hypothetical protein
MLKRTIIFFFTIIVLESFGYAQGKVVEADSLDIEITLSAFVEPKQVPLNHVLIFTVSISWQGKLQNIEIKEIEEPVLSNFEIIGTASSNRVIGTDTGKKSIKEVIYNLQPKTLGMGYIESVVLSYEDQKSNETHILRTQRIGVEVISPVVENTNSLIKNIWIIILLCLIVLASVILIYMLHFRKKGTITIPEEDKSLMEEMFLNDLKESVDLKNPARRETYSILTKLFRKYLSEKYSISALEATTDELLHNMQNENIEESLLRKCEVLFTKADVVKFSGQEATQAELEDAYTVVETILESNLSQIRAQQLKVEEESKKKRKKQKKSNISEK